MTPLPPRLNRTRFDQALKAMAGVTGSQWLFTSDDDRLPYHDDYAPGVDKVHLPSAAVAPADVAQVQALVRIANEFKVPLSPISRGRNLAYGGAAPRQTGAVVLDLGRMNRILEVDAKLAYCAVEPGVGFYDLAEHLDKNNIPLWPSVPVQAMGSVIGNALERGSGLTAMGDHSQQLCGLEVVLPTGELVRTGMGAMDKNPSWHLYKNGYGPGWDQMFCQSNLGIVTRAGVWLMPSPPATIKYRCKVMRRTDLAVTLDMLVPLRQQGIIDQYMSLVNHAILPAWAFPRSHFTKDRAPIPDAAWQGIIDAAGLGWWNFEVCLYGDADVIKAKAAVIERAFARHPSLQFERVDWREGQDLKLSAKPVPDVSAFTMVNWAGGRGGHIDVGTVIPADGRLVSDFVDRAKRIYDKFGLDHFQTMHIGQRFIITPSEVFFNRDDDDMTERTRQLMKAMVDEANRMHYGVYRSHLRYMDQVAGGFDSNGHALMRLNQRVKDALDPNGILAPGKNGIWPKAMREEKR